MSTYPVSRHLGVDDIFPCVEFRNTDGRPRVMMQFAGRPLLVYLAARDRLSAQQHFRALTASADSRALQRANILIIEGAAARPARPVPDVCSSAVRLADPQLSVAQQFGLPPDGALLLLDRNLRVVAIFGPEDLRPGCQTLTAAIGGHLAPEPFTAASAHAPVLQVPRVFSPAFCRHLIQVFETSGHAASGFNEQRPDGAPTVLDARVKARRDHVVPTECPLAVQIRLLYLRRLIPEVQKVFNFAVASHEAFKIARYDARDHGFFKPHRDNTNKANVHRRFAVSVNLNSDYEGGQLVFPEYGEIGYRPKTGSAVVFGCSLLHEARPVTRGARYVQLSFLY